MATAATDMIELRSGAAISGALHVGVIVFALFGASWFSAREPLPLEFTEVELVDGANFDAMLSTAPIVPNEGPSELSPKAPNEPKPIEVASPDVTITAPSMPLLDTVEKPTEPGKVADLHLPPPPTEVPTEAPRPSIALIPTLDPVKRQTERPESPPATEPMQALAAAPTLAPAPKPVPPAEAEPVKAEEPQPEPEKLKPEPDTTEVAQAQQPDAPISSAPQEARLPVAKPAQEVGGDRAASKTEPPKAAEAKQAEKPTPAEEPKPSGGSTSRFAATVTEGEKDALRLGIHDYFVYNGNRSDRTLQVTVSIRLNEAADIVEGPELINASGGNQGAQNALFQAGRRALLKAQSAGVFRKLPPEKYEGWKLIHVTFTPEEIGFSS